ncbi:MAG TPA: adenylate/guanylate cyclase domain-containing protein [Methylomirabilota bacterium]|nr:adenylate/guanylate cyclase domain-containing protein [Methylomirabilota bacterium]
MQCPKCTAQNTPDAVFCDECGGPLEAACATCGDQNRAGAKFCKKCGRPLAAPAPETYTPPHLAEKILTSRSALEGERKQVTVLFADIKGSMELVADRDPEEVRALLDPILSGMMEAVHYYEGTVNQVLGDGIMALFGAPLAHEDHAVRACYAALRMQESVQRYGREMLGLAQAPVLIRVGLNSGEVVVRAIGNDLHMDYTALGQTTHLAARMEQMAAPGSVLATASTLDLVRGYVQAQPLGPVQVKGLETPVPVYEIIGTTRARSRLQAAGPAGLTPLVGRREEMARLRAALDRAGAGRGQVVALTGEPGVGKSRLLYELVHSPAVDGWSVLESVAVPYGKATAYLPVVDLLRGAFQIDSRDDAATIHEKIAARLSALDMTLGETIPALLSLLDALPEASPFRALDPTERRRQTLAGLNRLLIAESRVRPVLLVVENLQWVDSQTRAFLDALVESLPTLPILLLVSYRPEYETGWAGLPQHARLRVGPLPPAEARELLRVLMGDDAGLTSLVRALIDRIGGNPFFLEESVRSLAETGVLEGTPGAYLRSDRSPAVEIPATIRAIVASRIDRLAQDDKRLLQAASIIGKDVPLRLLEPIAELSAPALRPALARLQAAGFLHERELLPDPEFTFIHALTHEVAYAGVLHERRRVLHAHVAEVIEQRLADAVERLAYHAFRGEAWEKAVTYARLAGVRAVARAANVEAVACFEQALAALEHLPDSSSAETLVQATDLRLDLRPPLLQLGRLNEVLSRSLEAERLASRLGDDRRLANVYTYLINYHYLKGEPDLAIEYGERCLAIAEASDDETLRALAGRYMGHIFHTLGQYRRAQRIFTENVERLEASPLAGEAAPPSVSYAASTAWLAFTLAELGEFDFADAYLVRAEKAANADGHAYSQAIAWTLTGLVRARQGRFEEALPPLERSLEACRERQLAIWQPIPSSLLGLTLATLGRPDEGVLLLESGVALTEELGVKSYLALWTAHLAEGLLAAGRLDQALATAEQALELAIAHRERGHQAWALHVLGEIAAHPEAADFDRAETSQAQALALARTLEMRPLVGRCRLALGQLYRRTGNAVRAEEHLASATELFCEMGMSRWLKEAEASLRALGRMFIVARDHPALHAYLEQAFTGDEAIRIVLDRRRGERRQVPDGHVRERRQAERRLRADVDARLRARALVVVN